MVIKGMNENWQVGSRLQLREWLGVGVCGQIPQDQNALLRVTSGRQWDAIEDFNQGSCGKFSVWKDFSRSIVLSKWNGDTSEDRETRMSLW